MDASNEASIEPQRPATSHSGSQATCQFAHAQSSAHPDSKEFATQTECKSTAEIGVETKCFVDEKPCCVEFGAQTESVKARDVGTEAIGFKSAKPQTMENACQMGPAWTSFSQLAMQTDEREIKSAESQTLKKEIGKSASNFILIL